ncbi:MAG: riboflavin synthase [Candidatus Abyssobacteria bacterium SURF_17]|jgi:riboflavin synthase|uniref:Riboflavin synthase n=1 Tax=Candidatus Abyssobacteria bacterium SURF_17 TaxID=2093361 RepID=A0A419EVS1_9BACT|nr:MAG: riboflavin synthase [Candidatus Abyssubacteria bacterium SURF_17]
MFTGMIVEIGKIERVSPGEAYRLKIRAKKVLSNVERGDSISVDGACLTVVNFDGRGFDVDAMPETIEKTTLKYLRVGSPVNLEPALKLGDKMGGHWVTGHVDGTGKILNTRKAGNSILYEISAPKELSHYLVPKGSVAVDGISLTIIECSGEGFAIGLIPHTLQHTTLGTKGVGDHVNLETDIIGKYVHRYIKGAAEGTVTEKLLHDAGFM